MATPHLKPTELWRAARENLKLDRVAVKHIESCSDCAALWEVVCRFPHAHAVELHHAPAGWVERAVSLARTKTVKSYVAGLVAQLRFDSWATPQLATLRGTSKSPARRLNWQADDWSVDLRVEEAPDGWNCTAQVLEGGQAKSGVEIRAGSMKALTDDAGLATWVSNRPPRTLNVWMGSHQAKLGPLSWQPPKTR